MTTNPALKSIEVFRSGTFTPLKGAAVSFSDADLEAVVHGYDGVKAPAPVVIGHPSIDAPAFGWVDNFTYSGGKLIAHLKELNPEFCALVQNGSYKKVSLSFFAPNAAANPHPGQWYPKHVGFLGAAPPAVTGLAPVSFASDEDCQTFEFGDQAFREVATLFRKMRDYFIDKDGLEAGENLLPDWHIRWIDDAAKEASPLNYSAPLTHSTPPQEDTMSKLETDDLKQREDALAKREQALAHTENVAFADRLISEGRLTPALKAEVVASLDFASGETETVEFADGDKQTVIAPHALLKKLFANLPKSVTYGKQDMGEVAPTVSFSAPQGFTIDSEDLEGLAAIEAYRKTHPTASFVDAASAVKG
jgi:hypothetical protein